MIRKSVTERNRKRVEISNSFFSLRRKIKSDIRNHSMSFEDRAALVQRLDRMKKDASPVRVRRRCAITGRSRGVYRKFGICRIKIRELAAFGMLPGVMKGNF